MQLLTGAPIVARVELWRGMATSACPPTRSGECPLSLSGSGHYDSWSKECARRRSAESICRLGSRLCPMSWSVLHEGHRRT